MTYYRNRIDFEQQESQSEDVSEVEDVVQLPNINHHRTKHYYNFNRIAVNVTDTQYDVILEVCENVLKWKLCFERTKNWDLTWTDHAVPVDVLIKMEQHQKINHFPGMNVLSRKNLLAKNLQKMSETFPEQYDFFPKTWLLPHDYNKLKGYAQQLRRLGITKTFIVKPEASSQGKGIYLTKNINQIPNQHCVVQKYVTNPLLFQGLKFDLRVYVLVAGCDPLRLYIYNEGLVRLATEPYEKPNIDNMDNMYMHLTNYAINKDHPNFIFNQSQEDLSHGHKRSLAQFFQTLKKIGVNSVQIWADIKDIIVKTMISGQPHLAHQYRMCQPHNLQNNMCFEVLGFDLMVDSNDKVYLLQINYTPSFTCQSPLDELVKSNLIRDTLVLMNINPKNREKIIQKNKEIQEKRVFTGKTVKMDKIERAKQVAKFQQERDAYENQNLGSYQKIYPPFNENLKTNYLNYLKTATETYTANNLGYKRVSLMHHRNSLQKGVQKRQSTTISAEQPEETRENFNSPPQYNQQLKPSTFQTQSHLASKQNFQEKGYIYNMPAKYREQSFPNVYQKTFYISEEERTHSKSIQQNIKATKFPAFEESTSIISHFISTPYRTSSLKKSDIYNQYPAEEEHTMFSRYVRR